MQAAEHAAALAGRIPICLLFVLRGWGKLLAPAATEAAFAKQGLSLVEAAWVLAVVVELGGGLAILVGLFNPSGGVHPRDLVRRYRTHRAHAPGRARHEIQFFKSMGLTGGFLYIAVFGAGAWNLDAWLARRRHPLSAE
jgi:putative oxidoreductase